MSIKAALSQQYLASLSCVVLRIGIIVNVHFFSPHKLGPSKVVEIITKMPWLALFRLDSILRGPPWTYMNWTTSHKKTSSQCHAKWPLGGSKIQYPAGFEPMSPDTLDLKTGPDSKPPLLLVGLDPSFSRWHCLIKCLGHCEKCWGQSLTECTWTNIKWPTLKYKNYVDATVVSMKAMLKLYSARSWILLNTGNSGEKAKWLLSFKSVVLSWIYSEWLTLIIPVLKRLIKRTSS